MNGILLTNKYHVSNNFLILKKMLLDSAKRHNINLIEYNNINIIDAMANNELQNIDFVLFWDKDVKLAKYLEDEGYKVFNSAESIRLCDDKSLTYLYLRKKGIRVPKTIFSPLIYNHKISKESEFIKTVTKHISFPMVFKECFGSFGQQVYIINDEKELVDRIEKTDNLPFIIQEFINTSFGRDLRIYVVGDKVIGGMERVNTSGDFRANVELGGKGKKYDLNIKQSNMALDVTKELKLDFAGVDILFDDNEAPILCEVNSNAYFIEFNRILNINIEDLIFEHIINKI